MVVENLSCPARWRSWDSTIGRRHFDSGLIMVSGGVYGQTRPLAQEWGGDGTGSALSGRAYLTGWPEGIQSSPVRFPSAT